ncbi:MAG: 50S ribosomal protein L21 [Planctomycetes bacterium]|jgi:large subunit ribosomal protein L21|nr:50S ribosomal protein L21 [Planctomycetota bacterium]
MYAVFEDRGKQYKAKSGEEILVDLVGKAPGESLAFDRVLFLHEPGKPALIGSPVVEGARVEAKVLGDKKAKKVIAFVLRKRKNSRRIHGHRQGYTRLKIVRIAAPAPKA